MITTGMAKKKRKKEKIMKMEIYKDELWHYYGLTKPTGGALRDVIDLPESKIKRIRKVIVAFFGIQEELEELYESAEEEEKEEG